jgi:hypothetical protein
MRLRRLRIAWAVAWGVFTLLLIGLWVRSLNWMDVLTGPVSSKREIAIGTLPGKIAVATIDPAWNPHVFARREWRSETVEVLQDIRRDQHATGVEQKDFALDDFRKVWAIGQRRLSSIPMLWMVLLSAALAPITLIRWSSRFTLRTLLVVTVLVAVALGAIVYETRK